MNTTFPSANGVPAEKPPGRDYWSYSALSLYASCPLRYFFKYIQGLPSDSVAASLVFGGALHSSLQHHYEQLLAGRPAPGLEELLAVYQDSWRTFGGLEVRFGKGEDINSLGRLADRMLRAFQKSDFARPEGHIIAIEEELRGELVPGMPDLLARVDLIVDTGDELVVSDFKTSRSAWSADHVMDSARQLLLYSELAKPLGDGKPLRLEFAVLTKAKFPELVIHDVPHDPQQVERTKRIVERVWRSIESGNFYPAPSPMNCPTCPFRQECRAWQG